MAVSLRRFGFYKLPPINNLVGEIQMKDVALDIFLSVVGLATLMMMLAVWWLHV